MRAEALLVALLVGCGPAGSAFVTGPLGLPNPTGVPDELGPMGSVGLALDPPGATFEGELEVRLLSADPDAEIWYTDDGSLPIPGASPRYEGPLLVSSSTQIRAVAEQFGGYPSEAHGVFVALEGATFTSDLPQLVLWSHGDTPWYKREDYEPFSLTVFEPGPTGEVVFPGTAVQSVRAGIKIRGSSSADYPKHPWRVETWGVTEDVDADIELLGMPSDGDWVLIAPLNFDRGLVRNALIYRLSNAIGRYAPRTRFAEVFIADRAEALGADDYQGIYLVAEQVERKATRVPITELLPTELDEPAITGGYLFKEDRTGPGELGFTAGTAGGAYYFQQPFVMVEPAELLAPPEQQDWLAAHIDFLGETLAAPDFRHPVTGQHYEELIDVDAWIDHHILNVFAKNPDGLRLSAFFHKEREGRIAAGPVWDFDRTMGCDQDDRATDPTWWDATNITSDTTEMFGHGLWKGLFDDPAFRDRYFARFGDLLDNELSPAAVELAIAEMENELESAAPRNYAAWSAYPPRGGSLGTELDLLRDWIARRQQWIEGCLALPDPLSCTGS